jgi:hypothetical protein
VKFDYAFVDNDVIYDFAALNLLGVLEELLPVDTLYRLGTAADRAQSLSRLSRQAKRRIQGFCEEYGRATTLNQEWWDFAAELAEEDGLDGGEAQLFACCAECASAIVTTGDSNSVYALNRIGKSEKRVQLLNGKIVLCESVLLKMGWPLVEPGIKLAQEEGSEVSRLQGVTDESEFRVRMSTKIERLKAATPFIYSL